MKIFDTHTHLYLPEFDADRHEAVQRAIDVGVDRMMLPNVGVDTIEPMRALATQFPDRMLMAIGLHPTEISENYTEQVEKIRYELTTRSGDYQAIGEIGLDLYWDKSYERQQIEAFDQQLSWAEELSLPVIIHCREAMQQTIEIVQSHKDVRGVFHCFSGDMSDARRILDMDGFYIGINGVATYRNNPLKTIIPELPLGRLVVETDAPYLSPVPLRGRRNECANILHTVGFLADTLGKEIAQVAEATYNNAQQLFCR